MDSFELFSPIVRDLVITVVVIIVGFVLKKWQSLNVDYWVKELVVDAVLFVQEKYWEQSGEEKFEIAKQWLVDKLNEKGIKVDIKWLEGLINSVVKQLRAEFGEEDWYRQK